MLEQLNTRQVNKVKKLAGKGSAGLFFATLYLTFIIIFSRIWKILKSPVYRIITVLFLTASFFLLTSFNPSDESNKEEEMTLIAEEFLDSSDQAASISTLETDETASLDDLKISLLDEHISENYITEEISDDSAYFDKSDWKLLLVNKEHPVPSDYTFTLGIIKGSMKCDERILGPLTDMFEGAANDNINLIVCSPYRDLSRQEYLFDRKMKSYINKGYSYIDAYKASASVVTVPGASEHQIGLSLDIICDTYSQLNEGFGQTEAGKWLVDNSYKYGFILRYPKDKEDITGIIYEPWHFRYVGIEAATVIHDNNLTLEEFINSI